MFSELFVLSFSCFSSWHGAYRNPPSFPTRRSSDLALFQISEQDPLGERLLQGGLDQPGHGAGAELGREAAVRQTALDRKSTRLNSSHTVISYAVFCLKKKKIKSRITM